MHSGCKIDKARTNATIGVMERLPVIPGDLAPIRRQAFVFSSLFLPPQGGRERNMSENLLRLNVKHLAWSFFYYLLFFQRKQVCFIKFWLRFNLSGTLIKIRLRHFKLVVQFSCITGLTAIEINGFDTLFKSDRPIMIRICFYTNNVIKR